jgi:hypothetical protein
MTRKLLGWKANAWTTFSALAALALYLSTFQARINGSDLPYATDVGEIQNALPRWGLIHRSGYPLYTATGSLLVTLLRSFGVQPAAGASLVSVLWGVVTVALLAALAHELGASGLSSTLGALAAALSTSVWVYASVAEVHTLTLALVAATLLFAVRLGREGERRDFLLLVLFFSQGVVHQRSVALLAPAVLVLAWPQLGILWRELAPAVGVAVLAPLTYLYMPLRVWMGASWVFGSPGTWEGFWEMVFDNRAERVFQWSGGLAGWRTRIGITTQLLADDLWWPLIILGLLGIAVWAFTRGRRREGLGLTLTWLPNLLLTLVIWENRVSDAQLAAKLPVVVLAGVGLALTLDVLRGWRPSFGMASMLGLALILTVWGWTKRPFVLSVTRDDSADDVIATAAQVDPPPDDCPTMLVAPWGHTYWALAYAQAYRGELPGLNVVDHNADFGAAVKRGERLLVLDETLHVFPVSWWEDRLGRLHLASMAPSVVELSISPPVAAADVPLDPAFELDNGVRIRATDLTWRSNQRLLLTVYWEAMRPVDVDYSVAVHLVARDPPQLAGDVLAQADIQDPVGGWYPTSRWIVGEVVQDTYALDVPRETHPVAVRVAMYRVDGGGAFVNSRWLSLPIPER